MDGWTVTGMKSKKRHYLELQRISVCRDPILFKSWRNTSYRRLESMNLLIYLFSKKKRRYCNIWTLISLPVLLPKLSDSYIFIHIYLLHSCIHILDKSLQQHDNTYLFCFFLFQVQKRLIFQIQQILAQLRLHLPSYELSHQSTS